MASNFEQLVLTGLSYLDLRKFNFDNNYNNPFSDELIKIVMSKILGEPVQEGGPIDADFDKMKASLSNWRVLYSTNQGDPKEIFNEEDNGFYGVAFKNELTGEVVVSFRGSIGLESIDVNDDDYQKLTSDQKEERINQWIDDWIETNAQELPLSISRKKDMVRRDMAVEFIRTLKRKTGYAPNVVTGHSMGGGLAEHVALELDYDTKSGVKVTTFNGVGALHAASGAEYSDFISGRYSNITNHVVEEDLVGNMGRKIDEVLSLINLKNADRAATVAIHITNSNLWGVVMGKISGFTLDYLGEIRSKNPIAYDKVCAILASEVFRTRISEIIYDALMDSKYKERAMSHVGTVQAINSTQEKDHHGLSSFYDSLNSNDQFVSTRYINHFGTDSVDHILGSDGDDKLYGMKNNDILRGGKGYDTLEGGEGNDTLIGGEGLTIAKGGVGNDTYVFKSSDGWLEITDQNFKAIGNYFYSKYKDSDVDTLKIEGHSLTEAIIEMRKVDNKEVYSITFENSNDKIEFQKVNLSSTGNVKFLSNNGLFTVNKIIFDDAIINIDYFNDNSWMTKHTYNLSSGAIRLDLSSIEINYDEKASNIVVKIKGTDNVLRFNQSFTNAEYAKISMFKYEHETVSLKNRKIQVKASSFNKSLHLDLLSGLEYEVVATSHSIPSTLLASSQSLSLYDVGAFENTITDDSKIFLRGCSVQRINLKREENDLYIQTLNQDNKLYDDSVKLTGYYLNQNIVKYSTFAHQ